MMRTFRKSKELMKAREGLVVAQAAKLKQVEKEMEEYKENFASNLAKLMTGSTKFAMGRQTTRWRRGRSRLVVKRKLRLPMQI